MSSSHLDRRAFVYVRQSTMMQVHEHTESRQRQYALAERAIALGWRREEVEVVDEDQGKSGASSDGRTGFARVAHAVAHGEAGAVLAIEVSRLARSSTDWLQLLQVCAVADVLVIDEQSVYDPSDRDDKMILDLKGTMSEAELHWLRLRLVGGRMNKARRGELEMHPPTGYVWRGDRFAFDPDEAIQAVVRLLFERFSVEPTAWAVVRWANEQGLTFPTRRWYADGSNSLTWRPLTQGQLIRTLHNPIYAGAYTYGRCQKKQVLVDGEVRLRYVRLTDPKQWPVRIEGTHPGYIDWETFVKNQDKLRSNQSLPQGATRGAPNRGPTLLAGLVICGRCGRRMRAMYDGAQRKRPYYRCVGEHDQARSICWSVAARRLDEAVENLFLTKMVPDEIDLSLAVEKEAGRQADSLEQQWRARLEQATYEARRAERRYKAVDPDNRVVARTLEKEWEERLRDLDDIEKQYADARRTRHVDLSAEDRTRIRALARDLPRLWRAPTTEQAERKAMLRLAIEAIGLFPVDVPRRMTRVRVQWHSGAVSELLLERPHKYRPEGPVLVRLRQLVVEGHHDDVIAARLNAEGLMTGHGLPWTGDRVAKARRKEGLERVAPKKTHVFLPDRHPSTGAYSIPGAARRFGVPRGTIKGWIDRGLIRTYNERYGRYNARWLEINDETAERLSRLASQDRSSDT
ncbi:MAG TPA: recombinase family protein [Thermoleophilia bacterium]|nr:recombinase family protein [Thermoleophilia bacterium]